MTPCRGPLNKRLNELIAKICIVTPKSRAGISALLGNRLVTSHIPLPVCYWRIGMVIRVPTIVARFAGAREEVAAMLVPIAPNSIMC